MSTYKDRETGELPEPRTAIVIVEPATANMQERVWCRIGSGAPFWLTRSESELSGHRYAIRYPSTMSAAKLARMIGAEVGRVTLP